MATEKSSAIHNENVADKNDEDITVTDTIHERFRRIDTIRGPIQIYIRCDDCNIKLEWDADFIKNHYNPLHPSNKHCRYCKGKVFIYQKIIVKERNETAEEIVYHRCEHNKTSEENV